MVKHPSPHTERISVNEACSVYRFRKDEITGEFVAITDITPHSKSGKLHPTVVEYRQTRGK